MSRLLDMTDRKIEIFIIILILLFAFFPRYIGLMDAGITWDEPITINAGVQTIVAISHFDFNGSAWQINYEHPPVGKYIYGIFLWLFNGSNFDYNGFFLARLASAFMGVATCLLVYLIGKEYFNREIGIVSAMILALIPDFVAHTQIAALDSPIAFFFTLTMFLFMLAIRKSSFLYYGISAISLGLLIGVKLNGLFAIPVMVIFYILYRRNSRRVGISCRESENYAKNHERHGIINPILSFFSSYVSPVSLIVFCLITIFTIVILWPWLWFNTPERLSMTLNHWTGTIPHEYLFGNYTSAPIYYYFVYFGMTTPLLLFIPIAAGIWMTIKSKDPFKYAILLWLVVPFAYNLSNFVQGGMRYLLMIYPAVALLSGYGLFGIAVWIKRTNAPKLVKDWIFPAACIFTIIYLIVCLFSVHPYYLDYYNPLSGGYQKIHDDKLLDFGWWGEGLTESVKYVESTAPNGSTIFTATLPYNPYNTFMLYGKNMTYCYYDSGYPIKYYSTNSTFQKCDTNTTDLWDSDYIIINYYYEEYNNIQFNKPDYKLVYEVHVGDAPIVTVYKKN